MDSTRPVNQKLTFEDEPEEEPKNAPAPVSAAQTTVSDVQATTSAAPVENVKPKKTPNKRASTGVSAAKNKVRTPRLEDYFPLMTPSSSVESSLSKQSTETTASEPSTVSAPEETPSVLPVTDESKTPVVVAEQEPLLPKPETEPVALESSLSDKSCSNDAVTDAFATPKGGAGEAEQSRPQATPFDGAFATPCHRVAPGTMFSTLPPNMYKTPIASSLKKRVNGGADTSIKKSVQFSRVNVFLFERKQGYNCIPSDDTSDAVTLGMSPRHIDVETYDSLDSFSRYKREIHLQKLKEEKGKILDEIRTTFLMSKNLDVMDTGEPKPAAAVATASVSKPPETAKAPTAKQMAAAAKAAAIAEEKRLRNELMKEIEKDVHEYVDDDDMFERKIRDIMERSNGVIDPFKEEDKTVLEILDNIDHYRDPQVEMPVNMELFLPILGPDERRQLLLESGVDDFDNQEANEISDIRGSRQFCGCSCKSEEACSKEQCSCFASGIPCQLDKTRFPCACSLKRCKNPSGIKRFDQRAVLDHYKVVLTNPDSYDPLAPPQPPPPPPPPPVESSKSSKETENMGKKSATPKRKMPESNAAVNANVPPVLTLRRDQEESDHIDQYPVSPVPKRSRSSLKQIQQQQARAAPVGESTSLVSNPAALKQPRKSRSKKTTTTTSAANEQQPVVVTAALMAAAAGDPSSATATVFKEALPV